MVVDYIEKTYFGWLGKIVGIRMGAPIENWTKEKIELIYGQTLRDYPVNYQDFAADDDSNGPLFFVRGMEHHSKLTPEAMGSTCLNYIPKEHGFFWWGDELSTEHTAFKNLYAGIKAGKSGSAQINGMEMAEQIGGQIFIDGFGFVAPGNPFLACQLAEASARVTHDYDGIAGARFIAACISIAYVKSNVCEIMKEALTYIDPTRNYYKVVNDMISYYESGRNWEEAFLKLREDYWTNKFGGVCHIVPNAGIIAIALLYGEGDFLDTMELVNRLGFDTDCNAGNVGAIMGVMTKSIPEHLIAPIKDILLASSVVGSLNITSISESTLLFCKIGYEWANKKMPEPYRSYWYALENEGKRISHFEFEGAIHGFQTKASYKNAEVRIRNTKGNAFEGERCLKITVNNLHPSNEVSVYQKTYYQPEDLHDARYQPCFSPIAYPGDEISCYLHNVTGQKLKAYLYAYDSVQDKVYRFSETYLTSQWTKISGHIPFMEDAIIKEIGLILRSEEEENNYFGEQVVVYLDQFTIQNKADYAMNFCYSKLEDYTLHDVEQFELRGFTHNCAGVSGIEIQESGLLLSRGETIYTGDYYWRNYQYEICMELCKEGTFDILFRCQGNLRYYAVRITQDSVEIVKCTEQGEEILISKRYVIKPERVVISCKEDEITVEFDHQTIHIRDCEYRYGMIGMKVDRESKVLLKDYRIQRIE